LLDRELERPGLHEYTQVIMKEADRLQSLMDRLLTPHRLPQPAPLNIHEVLERVRSLILANIRAVTRSAATMTRACHYSKAIKSR
jgi:two-component system nitrogen regulation sensor histidine kinase GlnL